MCVSVMHRHGSKADIQATVEDMEPSSSSTDIRECRVCCDQPADVTFQPCGHQLVCDECCIKMKKCLECQQLITSKISKGKIFAWILPEVIWCCIVMESLPSCDGNACTASHQVCFRHRLLGLWKQSLSCCIISCHQTVKKIDSLQ